MTSMTVSSSGRTRRCPGREVRAEGGDPDVPGREGGYIRVEGFALVEGEEEDTGDEAPGAREDEGCGGDVPPAGQGRKGEKGRCGDDEDEGSPVGTFRGHASPPAHRVSR